MKQTVQVWAKLSSGVHWDLTTTSPQAEDAMSDSLQLTTQATRAVANHQVCKLLVWSKPAEHMYPQSEQPAANQQPKA
jgi:hypothetical protein